MKRRVSGNDERAYLEMLSEKTAYISMKDLVVSARIRAGQISGSANLK